MYCSQKQSLKQKFSAAHAPCAGKILAFAPGACMGEPQIPVVRLDGTLPVRGAKRMPDGAAYGVVAEGVVVAWAVAQPPDAHGVRHITVETDLRYRRRGYAVACLQALARSQSAPLLYLCDGRNAPSAATALRAGFVLIDTLEERVPE